MQIECLLVRERSEENLLVDHGLYSVSSSCMDRNKISRERERERKREKAVSYFNA
jgi:hypothetical protein